MSFLPTLVNPMWVALYRIHGGIPAAARTRMVELLESQLGRTGYPWFKVIRIMLDKNFWIPYRRGPNNFTPTDLMYGNQFEFACLFVITLDRPNSSMFPLVSNDCSNVAIA